jgi:hypothetical protein
MGVSRSASSVLRSKAGAEKASRTPSKSPIFSWEDADPWLWVGNTENAAETVRDARRSNVVAVVEFDIVCVVVSNKIMRRGKKKSRKVISFARQLTPAQR